jgi:hypothetical protein
MFCCADICGVDTTISERENISTFPGHRRLVPTGGNALREYDPVRDDTMPQKESLLLVQVPPGINAGETIHVQIPGEDRILAVQVPAGVSEFHVSYEPTPHVHSENPISSMLNTPSTSTRSIPDQQLSSNSMPRTWTSDPKFVLVQVPDQIPPESFIQVPIPGQNRFIMAQVPYGVREFYVSVDCQSSNHQLQTHPNTKKDGVADRQNYNTSNQQDESNVGIIAPLVAGAALMGAAGYMLSQHGESDNWDDN